MTSKFVPIPDVCKAVIQAKTGAREWSFSLYFAQPGFDSTDMADLAAYLSDTWLVNLALQLTETTNFHQLTMYDMRSEDGDKLVTDVDIDGDAVSPPASVASACVVTYYASKRGPWNRGRTFVTGISEEAIDEYTVTQSKADGVRDVFKELLTEIIAGWTWVVVSTYKANEKRLVGIWAPVISAVVRNLILGTQRRRLRKQ